MPNSNKNLRTRGEHRWLLPTLLILAIVAIDIRLYLMAKNTHQEITSRTLNTLRVSADVVLGRVDEVLNTYDRTLSGIGEVVSARGGIADVPDITAHRLLVRRHAITPGLHWLLLVRQDGMLGEQSSDFPAPRLDLSDREYFQFQMESWNQGFFVGAPLRSKLEKKLFIPISRRVVNDGSLFLGVVAGGIDPEELEKLLAAQSLTPGYSIHLFINGGKALACFPSTSDCLTKNWNSALFFEKDFLTYPKGEFSSSEFLPDSRGLGAYSQSTRYPVLVVVTADEASVLAPWRRSLEGYWVVALGSNLFLIVVALFAYRQIKRRRYAMAKLAKANQLLEKRVTRRTAALHKSELRARTFMNTAMDAVLVIDSAGKILEFNKTAEKMFGYSTQEMLGQSLGMLMPSESANRHQAHILAIHDNLGVRLMGQEREVLAQARDGRQFPIEVTIGSSTDGEETLHVGIIRDITERKRIEDELRRLATTDGLTGVLNRRAFTENTERLIALAKRHQLSLALLIIDADHFKKINDSYGHPAGDAVLKALSRTLGGVLRATDLLGRLGGEEFGIAVPETDEPGIRRLVERLLECVRQCCVKHEDFEIRFTVSIGIATLVASDDFDSIFQRADAALYKAKQAGRDRMMLDMRSL